MNYKNFQDLLDQADYNKEEAQHEASISRYSSQLPPPKKLQKSNVQSEGIRRFLENQKKEKEAKEIEAQKLKEKLLAIRATSTKNNKKAKIMASRTKDNDFSKIRLTEDEKDTKKKIEVELQRKKLADKVERMKARIEMEEKEKLLPRKRKRKSKQSDSQPAEGLKHSEEEPEPDSSNKVDKKKNAQKRPPPPNLSFADLLKVAEVKQHEEIDFKKKKKEEEKLMTKKERRAIEEEKERIRRKQERLILESYASKPSKNAKLKTNQAPIPSKKPTDKPLVVRVQKNESAKQKSLAPSSTIKSEKTVSKPSNALKQTQSAKSNLSSDRPKPSEKPVIRNGETSAGPSRDKLKPKKISVSAPPAPQVPDMDAYMKEFEKRVTEKLKKEFDEKLALATKKSSTPEPTKSAVRDKPKPGSMPPPKKPIQQPPRTENGAPRPKPQRAKITPFKQTFHQNPYMAPPQRRLEPIRPQKPTSKRRIESDDEEDDDMSDFIDDETPTEYDEQYSKYIKQIFNYDRDKYADMDDDDIEETSFAEQMKEETRSAKLGFLEDQEEERKEREREMRRKKKLKK